MQRLKLYLLSKSCLWRITDEREERNEPDGWFPSYRIYSHIIYNATIHIRQGLFSISKEKHVEKFCKWYLKNNKATLTNK